MGYASDVSLVGALNIFGTVSPLMTTSDGLLKVSVYEAALAANAALETGGNLAAIAAKDFATQTTLAAIKAKTDNLDVLLSTRTKPSDTQTVSGSVSVSNFPASQAVTGTFWPGTQPVSGTFWQATQPVSLASMPSTPVTGTFWQATQPISGSVTANVGTTNGLALDATLTGGTQKTKLVDSAGVNAATISAAGAIKVDNSGVTQPVSGTFWQATQPVSGTFFQATQPVSIAAMPSTPVTGTFWQATQPVSGAFFQATQPVSIASMPSTPVTGTFFQATQPVSVPAITKGTQGANGLTTQDLKDAGRNPTNYFMAAGVAGTNAEVMQSLTGYKGGAAVVATATPAVVTAGKTYRITSITLSYQSLATAGACLFRLRANLSGAGVIGSPMVLNFTVGSLAAVAGVTNTLDIPFPDGLEFAAGTGIAVGMVGLSAVGAAAAAGFGTITIYGYEY